MSHDRDRVRANYVRQLERAEGNLADLQGGGDQLAHAVRAWQGEAALMRCNIAAHDAGRTLRQHVVTVLTAALAQGHRLQVGDLLATRELIGGEVCYIYTAAGRQAATLTTETPRRAVERLVDAAVIDDVCLLVGQLGGQVV